MDRRRLAPVVLLVGLGLALGMGSREWPRDNELALRLEGERAEVRRIELRVASPEDDEVVSTQWSFEPGKTPPVVRGQVRVPPGKWRVRVRVETASGPRFTERMLRLEGDPTNLAVPVDPP